MKEERGEIEKEVTVLLPPPRVLLWTELCPPPPKNSYVKVLTPKTSECDYIWRLGL